jgi:hypothetical protein
MMLTLMHAWVVGKRIVDKNSMTVHALVDMRMLSFSRARARVCVFNELGLTKLVAYILHTSQAWMVCARSLRRVRSAGGTRSARRPCLRHVIISRHSQARQVTYVTTLNAKNVSVTIYRYQGTPVKFKFLLNDLVTDE